MPVSYPIPPPIWPSKMSVRLLIMQELRARLAQITVANGYATNIGLNLWYGQQTSSQVPVEQPITYYWDAFENPAPQMGTVIKEMQIQMQSFDHVLNIPPADVSEIDEAILIAQQMPIMANQQLADLEVALMQDPRTGKFDAKLCGLAHGIRYQESEPFFGIQPSPLLWCGVNSQWVITYQHKNGDPYLVK